MADIILIFMALFAFILMIMGAFLTVVLVIRVRTMALFGGAPYVASTRVSVDTALKLAGLNANDRFADLGCGDGQAVLAAAKLGAKEAVGFEIDPLLAREARKKVSAFPNASVLTTDFWNADLSRFNVIFFFQIPYAMARLEKKLLAELKPGVRVVSNGFKFPNWKPSGTEGSITLYSID